jgi:hypothetical protein
MRVSTFFEATNKGENPEILSALDLPMDVNALDFSEKLASDYFSYLSTEGEPFCQDSFPDRLRCWGLADSDHAQTDFRKDPSGNFTEVSVLCGLKLWVVATPTDPKTVLSSDADYDDIMGKLDKYTLEAMALLPGTRL